MVKLLTCDTWVTRWDWFDYAQRHLGQVPFLLVDRSPCTEPFLDPYASSEERRPIISGLCRCFKNFHTIYIYITRVDDRVCRALNIEMGSYLGIAALKVIKVHASHEKAAETFERRRYVVAPDSTPYPPNLAYDPQMPAAVLRESCIVSLDRKTHYTPDRSTDAKWRRQVRLYYERQQKRHLRAAECRLHQVDGRDVLQLKPEHAPELTPADWGGKKLIRGSLILQEEKWADHLYQKIANGR